MSMMMPPDPGAAPGLAAPPGGAPVPGAEMPPLDAMGGAPLPAEGGIQGLIAALGGGGSVEGAGLPGGAAPTEASPGPDEGEPMSAVDHIQQAMKHLMMAMAGEEDDERGHGIIKGMGALQAILGGEQKRNKLLEQARG